MRTRLTQKQETFCIKYFELGNAAEAARLAKYSPRTADAIGRENLQKPTIQARIAELREEVKSAAIMSVQERQERLTEIARARLTDFMELGQDGAWVNLGPEVPMSGAIQEMHSRTEYDENGARPTVHTKVKLHNPMQAIDLLNKMDKIYSEGSLIQNNISRTVNILVIDQRTKDLIEHAGDRTEAIINASKDDKGILSSSGSMESGQAED